MVNGKNIFGFMKIFPRSPNPFYMNTEYCIFGTGHLCTYPNIKCKGAKLLIIIIIIIINGVSSVAKYEKEILSCDPFWHDDLFVFIAQIVAQHETFNLAFSVYRSLVSLFHYSYSTCSKGKNTIFFPLQTCDKTKSY